MDLYLKGVATTFLNHAHEEGLITLKKGNIPLYCQNIQRGNRCACPFGMFVNEKSVIVPKDQCVVSAYPCYSFPEDCTLEEHVTIVTWLTRNRFLTYKTFVQKGHLHRITVPNKIFEKRPHATCPTCMVFTLLKEPVFFLPNIVLSAQNKGPNLESVLIPNESS